MPHGRANRKLTFQRKNLLRCRSKSRSKFLCFRVVDRQQVDKHHRTICLLIACSPTNRRRTGSFVCGATLIRISAWNCNEMFRFWIPVFIYFGFYRYSKHVLKPVSNSVLESETKISRLEKFIRINSIYNGPRCQLIQSQLEILRNIILKFYIFY